MNKDMFFYSNFCDHCKEAIHAINKKNMRSQFVFVCVDTQKYKLPACVTHVPTIITRQKDVLTDGHIAQYIEKLFTSEQTLEISPYAIASQSGYSSSYTWLTESGYDNEGNLSLKNDDAAKGYVMIGAEPHIFAPKEAESTSKSSKFDDSMYEKYVNSRAAEDEALKRQMGPRPI